MKIDLKETFIVFDLDDTLYKERDYFLSGVNFVIQLIDRNFGPIPDLKDYVQNLIDSKSKDIWGDVCSFLNLPLTCKESFIWAYRLHKPSISLDDQTKDLIEFLLLNSAGIAILTDGRSITQRLKIKELGLSHLPVFISEEFNSEKPEPLRFNEIEKRFQSKKYVYIGDNPRKDFVTPNLMNWLTIGLNGDNNNIHSQNLNELESTYHPQIWINSLNELKDFIIC